MTASFVNQVAIITGAGEGIGYTIAEMLASHGASILLNDIDESLAQDSASKLVESGGVCIGVGGDAGDPEIIQGFVNRAVEEWGQLNIVCANAGLTLWGSFFEMTPDRFMQVVNVNLRGSYFLAQMGAKQMKAQGTGGKILFTSSVVGHQAHENLSAYAITKAGLEMLARNLVLELSPHNININCVAPGATVTPRNLKDNPEYEEDWSEILPFNRAIQTDDIANAALFLLSPQAKNITGQTIIVDGGWTATSPTPDETD